MHRLQLLGLEPAPELRSFPPRIIDAELEIEFRQQWLDGSLYQVRFALVLVIALTMIFIPIDRYMVSAEIFEGLLAWRVFVHIPLVTLCFATTFVSRVRRHLLSLLGISLAIGSLAFSHLAYVTSFEMVAYSLSALTQVLIFLVLARVPVSIAAPCAVFVTATFAASVLSWGIPNWVTTAVLVGVCVIAFMLMVAVYQRDYGARQLFLSRRLYERERLERIGWLNSFTRFLKHEVGNQIVAARTSLDLLESRVGPHTYIARGKASCERMRDLMSQAVVATSLEQALAAEEKGAVHLDEITEDRIINCRDTHSGIDILSRVEEVPEILGNELRLIQLVDNLLSNAVQHKSEAGSIGVRLRSTLTDVLLEIDNEAFVSARDISELFLPGVTYPGRESNSRDHFGLGLYVARTVAEDHGGSLRGELIPAEGRIRFTAVFPLPKVNEDPAPSSRPT